MAEVVQFIFTLWNRRDFLNFFFFFFSETFEANMAIFWGLLFVSANLKKFFESLLTNHWADSLND